MANQDNECKDLEVTNEYVKSENTLHDLMMLQKGIQEKVYGHNFKKMQEEYTLEDMRKFFDWHFHAISDELREMMDATGGIKDGIGSAIWKPWKSDHVRSKFIKFKDMSPGDLKELKMELIDIQHFLFNLVLAVGMTPEEFFNFYFAKNKENIDRQKRGY